MKKRWLLIVALVICAVLLLGACSPIDAKKVKESKTLDSLQVAKIDALGNDYSFSRSNGMLALFSKTDDNGKETQKVINVDTGAVIYTLVETDNKEIDLENGQLIISTYDEEKDTVRYTVYDNAGQLICDNVKEYRFVNDCLVYDQIHVVRFDEDTDAVKETYTRSEFDGTIPQCDEWTDDYYYEMNGRTVEVYDKHYVRTATYTLPSYVSGIISSDNISYQVLDDGTIVTQGLVEVDAQSDRYDILQNGKKYDLFTIRINPKNGKTQKLSVDFVIFMLRRASDFDENDIFDSSVKNIGIVVKITDKKLSMAENNMHIMSLDSRLKGNELFVVNGETVQPEGVGNGYLVAEGVETETTYLLSAKLKVLANMDAVRTYTEKYILTKRGIYDYNLQQLVDLSDKDYEYVDTVGNYLIFSEAVTKAATENEPATTEITYYLYNGSFKKIADDETWDGVINDSYYALRSTPEATTGNPFPDTTYSYYDASGNLLFTSVGLTASTIAYGNDWCIMSVRTADGYTFYRVQR